MAVRCGEMVSTDTLLALVPIGLYVAEEQVFAQHQQLYAGLHRKAGAHKVCGVDIQVFICHAAEGIAAEICKRNQCGTTAFGNRCSGNDQTCFAGMERAKTRSSEVSCRALIFIRVLSS